MELADKIEQLRPAFPVRYAYREDAQRYGYLTPYDPSNYDDGEGREPWVDLGSVARGEDQASQTSTVDRSNYRRLHEDHPDVWTDMSYSNVDALGAFVADLDEDLINALIGLAHDYPVYDDEDISSLEMDEISDSWDQYVSSDFPRELPDGKIRDRWDAMEPDIQRMMFWAVTRQLDAYPEHNGLEVLWSAHLPVIAWEVTTQMSPWPVRKLRRFQAWRAARKATRARMENIRRMRRV